VINVPQTQDQKLVRSVGAIAHLESSKAMDVRWRIAKAIVLKSRPKSFANTSRVPFFEKRRKAEIRPKAEAKVATAEN
jgi:hypothetical protein